MASNLLMIIVFARTRKLTEEPPNEDLRHCDVHHPKGLARELAELVQEGTE